MKYFGFLFAMIMMSLALCAADAPADALKVVKGNNGQAYLFAQASTGGILYTDVYFRIGTAYEMDSASGITVMLVHTIDSRINAAIRGGRIRYYSTVTPSQIGFHFESATLDEVLPLIHDRIIGAKFDEESVEEAKAGMRADIDSLRHSEPGRTDIAIKQHLWDKDYKKLEIYGDQTTYLRITTAQFTSYHHKYLLPLNNTIAVTGTFSESEALAKMQKAFDDFRTVEFNPELINRVIEFKPIVNAVQLLSQYGGPPYFSVIYQNPGTRQDRAASYCAYMLSALINDKNGRLARSVAQAGITDLKASYDPGNFQGTLTISGKVTGNKFADAFQAINGMISGFRGKDTFTQAELDGEHAAIAAEFGALRSQTHAYVMQVAKYRFTNDENYWPTLADSIQRVSVAQLQLYIDNYFSGHTGVRCLYADTAALAASTPDQRYYPMDQSISDLTWTYPQNITDMDSTRGVEDLHRLIQYLYINPNVNVQINGYSDKGEYVKASDTAVIRFIRNTPTFRKAMPDVIRVNYLRIEMMRAMKIAKAIYEAGIPEDRISGTSMSFSSEDDQAAAANRKCTVTLDRIQPRLSLYEYHFGHKKEEPTPAKQ